MSNLLEQAIIDAAALKEVAMKNAEAALIEKYSKEFKDSVEKLLEQESTAPAEVTPDAAASIAAADPLATPAADPMMGMGAAGADAQGKEKAFKDVPSSFLDGKDSDVLEIDFDQLKKQLSPETEISAGTEESDEEELEQEAPTEEPEAEVAQQALEEGLSDLEEVDIEEADERGSNESVNTMALDELEVVSEKEVEEDKLIASKKKKKNGTMPRPEIEKLEEENIQISSEELEELAEELKVDINIENLSDGHMGSTTRDKREQRAMEFASARNYVEEERRSQEDEELSDLKSKLDEAIDLGVNLAEENDSLKEKVSEMYEHLQNLKENLEKLSVSNAKLLYTNKVLGNSSLNERQKEQIVESISNSTSVLEAKTIYSTLQSAVSGISRQKPKESLSEALIRGNSSPFLTRKQQQPAESSFAERMKKLAGIS